MVIFGSPYVRELIEEDERIRLHGVGKYLDTMKFRIFWSAELA